MNSSSAINILGLDISTRCIGYCIFDINGKITNINYIDLSKYNNLYEKTNVVKSILIDLKNKYNITHIFIEEALMRFRRGMSSAKTLSILMKFNGIISYIAFDIFKIIPLYVLAPHARKVCGVEVTKQQKKAIGIKEIVLNHVKALEKDFKVEYTKTGKTKPYVYDMADAYIIARYGWLQIIK